MIGETGIARTTEPAKKSPLGFPGGFSVLMAVYCRDEPELFERAVESVYHNSLSPDAFVLVVDGPVPDVLQASIDRRVDQHGIECIQLPVNVGLSHALNRGLTAIRTEWVARADADDFNVPDRFAIQAASIHAFAGAVDLIGGAIEEVDRNGRSLAIRSVPLTPVDIARRVRVRNPFNHMTVTFRAGLVRALGGYPHLQLKEDYALWAAMLAGGARCRNVPEVLVRATTGAAMYRRRGGMRYARSELDLQRHLYRLGLRNPLAAALTGAIRGAAFCLPQALRGWLYENVLRDDRFGDADTRTGARTFASR